MEQLRDILSRTSNMAPGSEAPDWAQMRVDSFNSSPGNRNEEDDYDCEICKNKGTIMRLDCSGSEPRIVTRDCKCVPTRNAILRMKRSGLKNIITDYTFSKYIAEEEWQKSIKATAVEYAKEPQGWFFVGGQSGSGKTHICTAICREFLLQGKAVRYMLWRDDVVAIKAAVTESAEYLAAIDRFKNAEVLYIDDLFKVGKGKDGGKQRPTGGDVNVAFEILNHRYNAKLPTVISSECTASDLLDIDEAVAGRILELGKTFNLKPNRSRNYRLRKAVEV